MLYGLGLRVCGLLSLLCFAAGTATHLLDTQQPREQSDFSFYKTVNPGKFACYGPTLYGFAFRV